MHFSWLKSSLFFIALLFIPKTICKELHVYPKFPHYPILISGLVTAAVTLPKTYSCLTNFSKSTTEAKAIAYMGNPILMLAGYAHYYQYSRRKESALTLDDAGFFYNTFGKRVRAAWQDVANIKLVRDDYLSIIKVELQSAPTVEIFVSSLDIKASILLGQMQAYFENNKM